MINHTVHSEEIGISGPRNSFHVCEESYFSLLSFLIREVELPQTFGGEQDKGQNSNAYSGSVVHRNKCNEQSE